MLDKLQALRSGRLGPCMLGMLLNSIAHVEREILNKLGRENLSNDYIANGGNDNDNNYNLFSAKTVEVYKLLYGHWWGGAGKRTAAGMAMMSGMTGIMPKC